MRFGLSCHSYSLPGDLGDSASRDTGLPSARELFVAAQELALEGVQLLGPQQADSRDFSGLVALRQAAEEAELFLELAGAGVQPEPVKTLIRTASVLGSSVLSLRLALRRPATPAEAEASLKFAAGKLREALPTCEKYGVAVAIENNMDYTSTELLRLLDQLDSEWIGISFDAGKQLAVMEPPQAALTALAPFVYNLHLSDWQLFAYSDGLMMQGCPLGDGLVDLNSLLQTISSRTPQVSIHLAARAERHELPILTPSFLDRFADRRPHDLAGLLRLYWERGQSQAVAGDSLSQETILSRSAQFLAAYRRDSQEPQCSKPSPAR